MWSRKSNFVVCQRKESMKNWLEYFLLSSLEVCTQENILFGTTSLHLLQQTIVFAVINNRSALISCNLSWFVTYHCVFPLALIS